MGCYLVLGWAGYMMKLQVTARQNHNYKLLYAARQKFVIAGNFCVAHHGLGHRLQFSTALKLILFWKIDRVCQSGWPSQWGTLFVICYDGLDCSLHIYRNFIMYLISWRN